MPASRIAFALADFISEVRALLPKDDKLTVALRLDSAAFDAVVRELKEYGAIMASFQKVDDRVRPVDAIQFYGMLIERIEPEKPFDLEKHLAGRVDQRGG